MIVYLLAVVAFLCFLRFVRDVLADDAPAYLALTVLVSLLALLLSSPDWR